MPRHWMPSCAASLLFAALTVTLASSAEARPPDIKLGMSAAFSGPNRALGRDMRLGIEACLSAVNATGGVNGRRLRLIALDDGYEPELARANMTRLVEQEEVLAVVGNVGTPTAELTLPIVNDRGVLLLGALTGAPLLRKSPPDRHVINLRAGYAEETAAMISGLLEAGIRPHEIAFFTQDDGFGKAGHEGALAALAQAGFPHGAQLSHGRYRRNTLEIEAGLLEILASEVRPKAVIVVGAYEPAAKFIRTARPALPRSLFLTLSFVDARALQRTLKGATDRILVTQVMPHPEDDEPMCREYRRDLAAASADATPGFVSLEGYVVARVLVQALRAAGPDVTRESLVDAVEGISRLDSDLGTEIAFGKERHQGSRAVWPMVFDGDRLVPADWTALGAAAY